MRGEGAKSNIHIIMEPNLNLHKFYGMSLPIGMGKAGCKLEVVVDNTAWLRAGLFGGGCGIWFNDQFKASKVKIKLTL